MGHQPGRLLGTLLVPRGGEESGLAARARTRRQDDWSGDRLQARHLFPEAAVRLGVIEEGPDANAAISDNVLAQIHYGAHLLRVEGHAQVSAARGVTWLAHEAVTIGGSTRTIPGIRESARS